MTVSHNDFKRTSRGASTSSVRKGMPQNLRYRSSVRSSEWIAFLYFLYLAGICWMRPLVASRRLRLTALSLALAAAIYAIATTAVSVVRDWTPLVYVSVGYYAT